MVAKESSAGPNAFFAIATAWMFFLLCYVSRVELSVIANDLMKTFNMTASTCGLVSSCLYITYVAIQIPTGVLLDKYGPRIVISLGSILVAIAVFLFGSAQSILQLQIGRLLLGVATASGFIGCTKLINELIPQQRYALFVGITMFMGCIGGICGSAPTAWMVARIGWRETTFIIAGLGALISAFAFFCMPRLSKYSKTGDDVGKMMDGLKILAKNPRYWALGVLCTISYLPITAVAELWCIPFMEKKFMLPTSTAAMSSIFIFVGYGIGSIITPCLAKYMGSCKNVLLIFTILTILVFLPIIYVDSMSFGICLSLLFLFGIFGGTVPLFFTMAYSLVPKQYGGSSSGFTNMLNMSGAIVFQPLLGRLLDYFRGGLTDPDGVPIYTLVMYNESFLIVCLCMALSVLLLFFIKDTEVT
ncbi:MAG: MFS transporter [Holosporales bacterium]|nr:MFS transporter [Holosporales bacterium]